MLTAIKSKTPLKDCWLKWHRMGYNSCWRNRPLIELRNSSRFYVFNFPFDIGQEAKLLKVSEMRNLMSLSSVAYVEERSFCGMVVHTMVVQQRNSSSLVIKGPWLWFFEDPELESIRSLISGLPFILALRG